MPSIKFMLCCCSLLLLDGLILSTTGAALPGPQNQPSVAEVRTEFRRAIDAAANRWHVAIVSESAPIIETQGVDISAALPHEHADDAISRIAAAFDYKATRHEDVFVLTKLFTSQADLPDVTPEEMSASLDGILRVLAPFNDTYERGAGPWVPQALGVMSALSQTEIAALPDGVPVSSLGPAEKSEIWRLAQWLYLSNVIDRTHDAATLLRAISRTVPDVKWGYVPGGSDLEFGFETSIGTPPRRVLFPFTHSGSLSVASNGGILRSTPVSESFVPPERPDPTAPTEDGLAAAADIDRKSLDTIEDIVARLNARSESGPKAVVDKGLAPKTVVVAGMSNASASRILLGVADAFGLEVRHLHDGTANITSMRASDAPSLADITPALIAVIPAPIRRCLSARKSHVSLVPKGFIQPKQGPVLDAYLRASGVIYVEAAGQFRAAGEPAVARSRDKSIKLTDLGQRCTNTVALTQSIEAFAVALWTAERDPPPYIVDFEGVLLKGGVSHSDPGGWWRFSIFLSHKNPVTGYVSMGVGLADALIPPQ